MREVKPTQKPVPSSDIKDLFFNSGLLDIWVTSLEHKYIDRFGNCHLTAAGMEWLFKELVEKFKVDMNVAIVAAGYITIDSFQQGADLPNNELTQRNHILRDETTGEYYRWDGDLPKQVPAGSTPQSTGGIGKGAWVSVGDAALRPLVNSINNKVERIPLHFDTVNKLIAESIDTGGLVRTLGLRTRGDGGGAEYTIVPPNAAGYKVTEYPTEFGDIRLANGNIAKRLTEIKPQTDVRYWAHRGGQCDVAENTLFAFQQAIDNGAYGVELDCSMSSDGVWYVYHDASLYVLTNGTDYFYNRDSAYIENLTFNKMKSSVYGSYIRIPRFSDFLIWAKNNGVPFTVEFKNPRPSSADADIAAGIQMIEDAGCALQSHVQVTVDKFAYLIRSISNDIKISYSVANLNTPDETVGKICRTFNNTIIQTNSNSINDAYVHGVQLAHAMGCEVICYTSNDKEDDIKKALAAGVKNIISGRGWENK